MRGRTFLRIMFDNLFINNAVCKTISALVKFCNEQSFYHREKLKFLKNKPLNNIRQENTYQNKFIFNTKQISGVDYK